MSAASSPDVAKRFIKAQKLTGGGFSILFLAAIALGNAASAQAGSGEQAAAREKKTDRIVLQSSGDPIASRGDSGLTRDDLVAYLLVNVKPEDRVAFLRSEERLQDVIRTMLRPRVVASDGIEQGVLDDPLLAAESYQAAVNFLSEKWLDKVADRQELDSYEQQAREAYLRNPEQFRTPEKFDFTHVLIRPDETGGQPLAVLEDIELAIDEGRDFDALVTEYTPDDARSNGRFTDVEISRLEPDFARALESLEAGEIAGPVETSLGWHFVRLDAVTPSEIPPFDEVKAQLELRARLQHRDVLKGNYVERLMDQPLEIDREALDEIRASAEEGDLGIDGG